VRGGEQQLIENIDPEHVSTAVKLVCRCIAASVAAPVAAVCCVAETCGALRVARCVWRAACALRVARCVWRVARSRISRVCYVAWLLRARANAPHDTNGEGFVKAAIAISNGNSSSNCKEKKIAAAIAIANSNSRLCEGFKCSLGSRIQDLRFGVSGCGLGCGGDERC
jgi:hypothetical protein